MRTYEEPVEVRRRDGAPEQFLWRERLWQVRRVQAHWVETGAWCRLPQLAAALGSEGAAAGGATAVPALDLLDEREVWRVEAGRGVLGGTGVFELALDRSDGHWQLVGCDD